MTHMKITLQSIVGFGHVTIRKLFMIMVLKNKDDRKIKEKVHKEIKALAKKFP